MAEAARQAEDVLRVDDVPMSCLHDLAMQFGLRIARVADGQAITGSFWGEPEAGIVDNCVFVRGDTPVHSLLHEFCHIVCLPRERRAALHTNAGSDDAEEAAVCYLQIVIADTVPEFGGERIVRDMDRWGYSFPEGNTGAWFAGARDSRQWLIGRGLLDARGRVAGHQRRVRKSIA